METYSDPRFADWHRLCLTLLEEPKPLGSRLLDLCSFLNANVPHYDWTGFYWVSETEERMLELGPYAGEATDHTHIPFGRGICGQVAESRQTLVVPDVAASDNYLACSLQTKAEIVLPVFAAGQMVGQLDIDSHTPNPFTQDDEKLLQAICTKVGELLE